MDDLSRSSEKATVGVLVNSCDKYSDVWEIFFPLFFKYWADCPWDICLGSNTKTYQHPKVRTILVGKDTSWADSTKKMLEQMPYDNILFFLEDFLIFSNVNNTSVLHYYNIFCRLNANYLRLRNDPYLDVKVGGYNELVEILPGELYRTSLDIAFWNRKTFLELLKSGESPWEMEIKGSRRSDSLKGFYASHEWVIERRNGLEAGKWKRYNLELIKLEGLSIPKGHKVAGIIENQLLNLKGRFYRSSFYKSRFYKNFKNALRKIYRHYFPKKV